MDKGHAETHVPEINVLVVSAPMKPVPDVGTEPVTVGT